MAFAEAAAEPGVPQGGINLNGTVEGVDGWAQAVLCSHQKTLKGVGLGIARS